MACAYPCAVGTADPEDVLVLAMLDADILRVAIRLAPPGFAVVLYLDHGPEVGEDCGFGIKNARNSACEGAEDYAAGRCEDVQLAGLGRVAERNRSRPVPELAQKALAPDPREKDAAPRANRPDRQGEVRAGIGPDDPRPERAARSKRSSPGPRPYRPG